MLFEYDSNLYETNKSNYIFTKVLDDEQSKILDKELKYLYKNNYQINYTSFDQLDETLNKISKDNTNKADIIVFRNNIHEFFNKFKND